MPRDEDGHIRAAITQIEADQLKRPHDANKTILLRLTQAESLVAERDADIARTDTPAEAAKPKKPKA